jgi:beta-galactosidase
MGVWFFYFISELQTPYEVPQENANRVGTRWVKLFGTQWVSAARHGRRR